MHLDLIDQLRCPQDHPGLGVGVALVCVPTSVHGRDLVSAMLGCPVCHAQFGVFEGVAWFGGGSMPPAPPAANRPPTDDELTRLAALLGLDTPGAVVLLHGDWASYAEALVQQFEVRPICVLDGPAPAGDLGSSTLAGVHDTLPLASGIVRGAALGASATAALLRSAATTLTPNGRLVAPTGCVVPPLLAELARDAHHWVAEPRAASVTLQRARPPSPRRTPGQ